MAHLIVSFVVFAGIMVVTAGVFGVWLLVNLIRLLVRFLAGPSPRLTSRVAGTACNNQRCLAMNPINANFCRRCGRQLRPVSREIPMRRAERWTVQSPAR